VRSKGDKSTAVESFPDQGKTKRKGGNPMKYEKPEIVLLASALTAVQGTDKGIDSFDHEPSNPAYVADE
jgi:hypothetical protein